MNYGIPYQGSKNRIADALIRVLPSGKRFVDLFAGGGAMTHIASISGKYESVFYNDIQEPLVQFFRDITNGEYDYERFKPKFISRAEFYEKKDLNAYIKYIWSFNNNGRDYMYNREIEDEKRAIHDYIVFGVRGELIDTLYPKIELTVDGINGRRLEWRNKSRKFYGGGCVLWQHPQLIYLNRMQGLEALGEKNIEFSSRDYREYEYRDGDVVYCDIPYENAREYVGEFEHEAFYDWMATRDFPVWLSSYSGLSDDRFKPVWAKIKQNKMNGAMSYDMRVEAMYCNMDTDFRYSNYEYVVESRQMEQLSVFEVC